MPMHNAIPSKGADVQPYKNNGKELDLIHGLNTYNYGARWMDPALGRWHSMDPLCETDYDVSPYAYCLNSPINNIDLWGLKSYDPQTAQDNWDDFDTNVDNIVLGELVCTGIAGKKDWFWESCIQSLIGNLASITKDQLQRPVEIEGSYITLDKTKKNILNKTAPRVAPKNLNIELNYKTANEILKKAKGVGIAANVAYVINTTARISSQHQVKVSDCLDVIVATGSMYCPIAGGIYVVTDMAVKKLTGKSIGNHLDECVDKNLGIDGGTIISW